VQATLEACKLRLRPIVMTSLAFILGVVPLMVSLGAGAEMRRTLGTAVFSGMLGVTLFGIFLTPVFFYVINQLTESHLLNTPFVRGVRDVTLGIFGLGYARRLGAYVLQRVVAKESANSRHTGRPPPPLPAGTGPTHSEGR